METEGKRKGNRTVKEGQGQRDLLRSCAKAVEREILTYADGILGPLSMGRPRDPEEQIQSK